MIEKLLKLIADQNKLVSHNDELSMLIKVIDNSDDELNELILEQVTAAKLEVKQIDINKENS